MNALESSQAFENQGLLVTLSISSWKLSNQKCQKLPADSNCQPCINSNTANSCCPALPCPALPCPALPCPALPCPLPSALTLCLFLLLFIFDCYILIVIIIIIIIIIVIIIITAFTFAALLFLTYGFRAGKGNTFFCHMVFMAIAVHLSL